MPGLHNGACTDGVAMLTAIFVHTKCLPHVVRVARFLWSPEVWTAGINNYEELVFICVLRTLDEYYLQPLWSSRIGSVCPFRQAACGHAWKV